jgi:hypothetical protein
MTDVWENKRQERYELQVCGDAGVMATLCKDEGRQTRRSKTRLGRSPTYL